MILSSDMRGVEISKEFDALRKTFTLLKGSQKSWIEAGDYVKVFKAHMPSGNTQQDVSEFVHKMLDVCENALKRDENNPVKQLFYGEILQTGLDQDKKVFTFTQRVVQKPHRVALPQQVPPRQELLLGLPQAQGLVPQQGAQELSPQEELLLQGLGSRRWGTPDLAPSA